MTYILYILKSILTLIGVFTLLFFIYMFIQYIRYKKAIEMSIDNNLQTGEVYSYPEILDLPIPTQKDTKCDFKVARYLADLIVRVRKGIDNPLEQPHSLKNELNMYDSKKNLFGVLFTNDDIAYIAFRGTNWYDNKSCTNNLYFFQKSLEHIKKNKQQIEFYNNTNSIPAGVHSGFLKVYNIFRDELLDKIEEINPKQIIIGGHSLGGAIATICGLELKILGYNVVVYNFSCPCIGDNVFCDLVTNSKLPLYRIINTCDIAQVFPVSVIPNFDYPTQPFIYTHCGEAIYFTDNWKSLFNNHLMNVYIKWLDEQQ